MTLGIISLGKTRHIVWPADSDSFFYLIGKTKQKNPCLSGMLEEKKWRKVLYIVSLRRTIVSTKQYTECRLIFLHVFTELVSSTTLIHET